MYNVQVTVSPWRSPLLLSPHQTVTPIPTSTPPTSPYPPHHRPLLHRLTSPVSTRHPHHSHRHPLTAPRIFSNSLVVRIQVEVIQNQTCLRDISTQLHLRLRSRVEEPSPLAGLILQQPRALHNIIPIHVPT